MVKTTTKHRPFHPREILRDEFLTPLGVSQYRLAQTIHVPPRRINEIVHCKRAVTADTALRLAIFFRTTAQFWMNLQTRHDLETAENRRGARLNRQIAAHAA
jgi:antitoxin HigA-1